MLTCYFENGDKVGLRHVVVSAIIIKDGKVLLSKRGTYKGKPILESGKWALLGGYVDRDETMVEAVQREAMEEAGWILKNIQLFRIIDNPNRPNDNGRQNVSIVFIADGVSCIPTTNEEVTEMAWFELDNLPPKEQIAFDFYDTLQLYKKYLKEKFPLPVFG